MGSVAARHENLHQRSHLIKNPDWPNSAGSAVNLLPEKSVLGLKAGDDVKLSTADFVRLSKAFFSEIEKRYL